MKVAVSGASGFIGRHLCRALAAAGHEVAPIKAQNAAVQAHVVVHLAGIAHRQASAEELDAVNVRLTERLGRQAAESGAHFVFLSSVKVHGERSVTPFTERSAMAPEDAYGASKARAEDALRAIAGLRLAVLRPPLVYGPGVGANFLALMRAIARGWPLPLASIDNRRSLIYVGNLVDAITRAMQVDGAYLVSDGAALSTPQLCRDMAAALDARARLFPFPRPLLPAKLAASLEVDDGAFRRRAGWQAPFTPAEGLRATADWYLGR
jgi:nucleoside-diphosphate-sugar epimerase